MSRAQWQSFSIKAVWMVMSALAAGAQETPPPKADEPKPLYIRFIEGPPERVVILSADAEGLTVRMDHIPRPVRFHWWQLNAEDAERLRGQYLGRPAPAPPDALTLPGWKVTQKSGKIVEGIEVPNAPAAELWIKNRDGLVVVPRDEILAREEITLELNRVYKPEELYGLLMDRLAPRGPEDFEQLGAELVRAKLSDRAVTVFKIAEVLRRPDLPQGRMYRELVKLRGMFNDITLKKNVYDIQESALTGSYDDALRQVDALEKAAIDVPENEEELYEIRRIRSELHVMRQTAREEQIVDEWAHTLDALLRTHAADRSLSFAAAADYVRRGLMTDAQDRVAQRFQFSPGDPSPRIFWDQRPAVALQKLSLDEATWVAERPEQGDAEEWWSSAHDEIRYRLLKGLFAEKFMTVVRVEHKGCPACGARGADERQRSLKNPAGMCASCKGLKGYRVIVYR